MVFVGRKEELNLLSEIYVSKRPELVIIYGRRRLGKTTLIKKSLENKNNYCYFLCTQENISQNLEAYKEQLSLILKNDLIREVSTESFERFFYKIKDLIPKNFIFVFDEFPYLISQDKSILSQFQKIYDEYFKSKNIKLILNGSSNSIMTDLLNYQSPLYGRRTASIKLSELKFFEVKDLLKNIKSLEDVVKYNLIFGGIPYYLEQINQDLNFNENITNFFFREHSFFLDEVLFLLKEEFKEIKNYLAILQSIAKGKTKFNEISESSNIDKSSLSVYLKNLEIIGLIENIKSFFDKQNSKKTIYKIKDNFIFFYYFVISKNINNLSNKEVQKNILNENIPHSFGFLFEKFCFNILKNHYEKIGTYFRDGVEIDILCQKENTIYCFECKFKKNINKKNVLSELNEKIQYLPKEYNYNLNICSIEEDYNLKKLLSLSKI